METREDSSEVVYMDGITYERRCPREDEEAYIRYSGSRYRWTTVTEEHGQQIGVCGTDYSLWRREGVILNGPSVETVSSVSLVCNAEPLFQVDDPAMIAAFMEVYHSDIQQAADIENDGDWQYGSLIMHHKDYPYLQYEIECCCSPEQGTACYRTSALGEWLPLPVEWCEIISEHGFPTRGE